MHFHSQRTIWPERESPASRSSSSIFVSRGIMSSAASSLLRHTAASGNSLYLAHKQPAWQLSCPHETHLFFSSSLQSSMRVNISHFSWSLPACSAISRFNICTGVSPESYIAPVFLRRLCQPELRHQPRAEASNWGAQTFGARCCALVGVAAKLEQQQIYVLVRQLDRNLHCRHTHVVAVRVVPLCPCAESLLSEWTQSGAGRAQGTARHLSASSRRETSCRW
jgi:hypothetical protein